MTAVTQRWPRGTGQWSRSRVLIVSADPKVRDQLLSTWATDHEVVGATAPLDVIRMLENEGTTISTIVLADVRGSVARTELAEFLREAYPLIRVMVTSTRSEADRSLLDDLSALQ